MKTPIKPLMAMLLFSGLCHAAPPNDDFESAQVLASSLDLTVQGSVESATSQLFDGEPDLEDFFFWSNDQTVWYAWTAPPGATWARFSVSGTNLTNQLAIYTGTELDALDRVALSERENPGDPGENRTTIPVVAGTQYRIRVLVPGYAVWDLPWEEEPVFAFNLGVQGITTPVSADEFVFRGRGQLAQATAASSVMARNDFASAVALDPLHEEARFLLAFALLLALEGETQFTAVLESLGIPLEGSLRDGGYSIPEDEDGNPVFEEGADTAVVFEWLGDAMLPRLAEIRTHLGAISSVGFRTELSFAESGITDFTVDAGDALALKAATHSLDMLVHLLTTYNLSVPLQGMLDLDRDGELNAERVLEIHGELLTFSATDRRAALAASLRALESDYLAASDFIRNFRVSAEGLLTESLSEDLEEEEEIRNQLTDAVKALDEEITLSDSRVNLAAFLNTTASPRDWLAAFNGDDVFGPFPDPTFGGTLPDNSDQKMRGTMYDLGRLWGMSQYAAEVGEYLDFLGLSSRPDDDADGDGTSNFAEWIFGGDAASPDVIYQEVLPQPLAGEEGFEIRFSFIRSIELDDWRLVVLVSDDMETWDDTETAVEPVGDAQPSGDGFSEIATYRLIHPDALPPRKFFRVEARPKL